MFKVKVEASRFGIIDTIESMRYCRNATATTSFVLVVFVPAKVALSGGVTMLAMRWTASAPGANERTVATAATTEAACKVKASMAWAWMNWKEAAPTM